MRALLAVVLCLLAACCASVPDMGARSRGAVQRIEFPGGGLCTAAAIGPHALLTARHCIGDTKAGVFKANGTLGGFAVLADDGHDHVILRATQTFGQVASIGPVPRAGSLVYLWGNPAGLDGVFRAGRIAGDVKYRDCIGMAPGPCSMLLVDANTAPGDSGAALFDMRGRVITVGTGSLEFRGWRMAIAYRLHFTPAQLAAARL
jgi:S1-C subfamily serine protease